MATDRSRLLRFARDAEQVASGLDVFRDGLPRRAADVNASIAELFAIGAILRGFCDGRNDLYGVQGDLELVFTSLRRTLDAVFDMLGMSRRRALQTAWDQLTVHMDHEERMGLRQRLECYHDFLKGQQDMLLGYRPRELDGLRRQLVILLNNQDRYERLSQQRRIEWAGISYVRPSARRSSRMETPASPISPINDRPDPFRRRSMPRAPEVPLNGPASPTYTSTSSSTFDSSHTSYSDTAYGPSLPDLDHWAQEVFDGQNPGHSFLETYQHRGPSRCLGGEHEPFAPQYLVDNGFHCIVELPFDGGFGPGSQLVRIYFRPADQRARILITTKDIDGHELYYTSSLTALKVIRDRSTLQLCRLPMHGGPFELWATLNFGLYERMVLFYCTFVAMKRQDRHRIQHERLIDHHELEGTQGPRGQADEELLFAAIIMDGQITHTLCLLRDLGSGVIRLEASPSRQSKQNIPLWTAFVTRYISQGDVELAHYEGNGLISLATLRPPPYIFSANYEPPRNRDGEYTLRFQDDRGDVLRACPTPNGKC